MVVYAVFFMIIFVVNCVVEFIVVVVVIVVVVSSLSSSNKKSPFHTVQNQGNCTNKVYPPNLIFFQIRVFFI